VNDGGDNIAGTVQRRSIEPAFFVDGPGMRGEAGAGYNHEHEQQRIGDAKPADPAVRQPMAVARRHLKRSRQAKAHLASAGGRYRV